MMLLLDEITTHNVLPILLRFLVALHTSLYWGKKYFRMSVSNPFLFSFRNSLGLGNSYCRTKWYDRCAGVVIHDAFTQQNYHPQFLASTTSIFSCTSHIILLRGKICLNVCLEALFLLFLKQSWSGRFLLQNERYDQCAGVCVWNCAPAKGNLP